METAHGVDSSRIRILYGDGLEDRLKKAPGEFLDLRLTLNKIARRLFFTTSLSPLPRGTVTKWRGGLIKPLRREAAPPTLAKGRKKERSNDNGQLLALSLSLSLSLSL
jgi:hypothetical protein